MAIQLTVTQSGGKVRVYAGNQGDHVAIIDHIVLKIEKPAGTFLLWKYQDDFYFGSGRIDVGWGGLMFEINYSGGPAQASAKGYYWEVDQLAVSAVTNLS